MLVVSFCALCLNVLGPKINVPCYATHKVCVIQKMSNTETVHLVLYLVGVPYDLWSVNYRWVCQ
jgi:hypothetical protein